MGGDNNRVSLQLQVFDEVSDEPAERIAAEDERFLLDLSAHGEGRDHQPEDYRADAEVYKVGNPP